MKKSQNKKAKPTRRILVLRPRDEMRHPYESALSALGTTTEWFDSFRELIACPESSDARVVIVDLDCLESPLDLPLEQLRTSFAGSDLIALSSVDSAALALQCIRSGFIDFLLKPVSPEELAWSIRRCLQRRDLYDRMDPGTDLLRAVTQISTCTTANLVRLSTIEHLAALTRAQGAAWIHADRRAPRVVKPSCIFPKGVAEGEALSRLPDDAFEPGMKTRVIRGKDGQSRKLLIPTKGPQPGVCLLWGVPYRLSPRSLSQAELLVEHAETCVANVQKFDEIRQQTFVDDLTGLYNSRYLKFALSNAMLRCKQPGHSFSVLFIDVDHFKSVNDKSGHLIGSAFLVAIGKTIKNTVRQIDPVFRYGGDEFVVILQDTALEGAHDIGERIRKAIERRVFIIHGKQLQTTVSIGIATYPQHATERETLLKLADDAMYEAKRHTRNSVHLAIPEEPPPTRRAG